MSKKQVKNVHEARIIYAPCISLIMKKKKTLLTVAKSICQGDK